MELLQVFGAWYLSWHAASSARRRDFFIEGGASASCSFLTRAKEAGVTSDSFFTQTLDTSDEPASFFGRRRRVVGVGGGDPMMMPPGVLGVDEEDHDNDIGASILRGTSAAAAS
jgi:hypothetical protein